MSSTEDELLFDANELEVDKGHANVAFDGVQEGLIHEVTENPVTVSRDDHSGSQSHIAVERGDADAEGSDYFSQESEFILRRRTQSVQFETSGFDLILDDMPSRTLGRKKGARMARIQSRTYEYATIDNSQLHDMNVGQTEGVFGDVTALEEDVDTSALRDLPVNMTQKRKLRGKAKETERITREKQISNLALLKFELSLSWKHFKSRFYSFLTTIPRLWHHHLKLIEGKFGSGVVSYFVFLRGIFWMSLMSFLLSFVFISIPQLLDRPQVPTCHFTGEAILTGSNCLTHTIMYQGYYTNTSINAVGNAYYDMPMAYLFTIFGYFILCLVWLVRLTATLFRQNYVDAQEEHTRFTNKVFCAWDFGITSQSTATIRQQTIINEIKEALGEKRRQVYHRQMCVKFELFFLRLVSWCFYFGLVGGAIAAVYFLNKLLICQIVSQTQNSPIFQDMALPLMVSTINLLMPYIIDWISSKEKYKYPRHQLYISVGRNFLFKMGLLGVIGAFWTSNNVQRCSNDQNVTSCWETNLGQEIYRLVVVDFIFTLLFSTFCAEFVARLVAKRWRRKEPEFLIANNVMDLIYGQTLCWIGVYFSPLLPLINAIKFLILFYVKRFSVMSNCRPSTKKWRATQNRALFNAVQLASFLLSAVFLFYILINEVPSPNCGPFRGQSRAYDVIILKVDELAAMTSGNWFATIIRIVTSVWVLDSIAIVLLITILFKRSETRALKSISKSLEEQIALEGRDKMTLLKRLQRQYKLLQDKRTVTGKSTSSLTHPHDGDAPETHLKPDFVLHDPYLDMITEDVDSINTL